MDPSLRAPRARNPPSFPFEKPATQAIEIVAAAFC